MTTNTFLGALLGLLPLASNAGDWPRYLGVDGKAEAAGPLAPSWQAEKPEQLWTAELGAGCSGFAVAGGIAVTIGNDGKSDTVWALDAKTGKVLWKDSYEEALAPKYYTGGPGATPTITGGGVYTLSKSGRLAAYRLADGKKVWQKDLQDDFGGEAPGWGYSAAPIVHNGVLLVAACADDGALLALDPATGEMKWKSDDKQKPGYGTPVIIDYEGKEAAVLFHGRVAVGYDLEAEGEVLFSIPWRTSYEVNASNPQYLDGKLFVASGYGMGYGVFDVTGKEPESLHADPDTRLIFQNSILTDDSLIAVFGDKNINAELMEMDFASGKIRWREKIPGTRASIARSGDTLLILSETGELLVGELEKDGFSLGGQMEILPRLCWAPLAVADGMVFARNNAGKAICLKLP